jgi:prepilin-type N-terminal cleavage/methylation domain-containing protein/prepilin-type processing-associated H-X9-DG protein
MNRDRAAFTLIELLVVVAIIGVLAALFFAMAPSVIKRGQVTASLNNMRQIGNGFQMYANDNDYNLPSRVQESGDKWPALINEYLQDRKVYADPSDPRNFLHTHRDPLSNGGNNTSYIMNGYNDLGAFSNENVSVKINALDEPSNTILLGNQSGTRHYYMDTAEGNQNDVLNKTSFGDGSNYLFADGSVRFVKKKDYSDELWLVHKTRTN